MPEVKLTGKEKETIQLIKNAGKEGMSFEQVHAAAGKDLHPSTIRVRLMHLKNVGKVKTKPDPKDKRKVFYTA
jgi:hypothetical protein